MEKKLIKNNILNTSFIKLSSTIRNTKRHSTKTIWLLLLAVFIIVSVVVQEFMRPANLANILIQMVPLGIVAIGQTIVILGGGIDLSVGAQISLITIIASSIMGDSALSILGVTILCLFLGSLFGTLNGLILKYFSIPSLIVTLCSGFLFQGIAYSMHQTSGGYIPSVFKQIFTASYGFISVPFILFLILFLIFNYLLKETRFGRYIYALGGNEEVLINVGINSDTIRMKTYIISGFLYAITGLYIAARLKSGSAHYGSDYALLSITATVVGGTSMAGGLGSLSGTFAGALMVSMLNNVLNNIGFKFNLQSAFYKDVIIGIILVVSMFFYRKREL